MDPTVLPGVEVFVGEGPALRQAELVELVTPANLKPWFVLRPTDRPVRLGSELPHQDPLWCPGGGLAGHGCPSALCRPLVPADHPLPPLVFQHHPH